MTTPAFALSNFACISHMRKVGFNHLCFPEQLLTPTGRHFGYLLVHALNILPLNHCLPDEGHIHQQHSVSKRKRIAK